MSDLVGNPKDRFSRDVAHFTLCYVGDDSDILYLFYLAHLFQLAHPKVIFAISVHKHTLNFLCGTSETR